MRSCNPRPSGSEPEITQTVDLGEHPKRPTAISFLLLIVSRCFPSRRILSRAIDARWSDQTSSPVPPVTFRNLLVLTPLPLFSARRISCESSPPVGEHVVRAGHEESLLGVTDCIMGVHGTPARLPLHLVVLHRLELRPMLCGYTSGTWTGRA